VRYLVEVIKYLLDTTSTRYLKEIS